LIQATVRELALWCGASEDAIVPLNGGDILVTGVSTDTRQVQPGQLFVPLKGERFDGHDYIAAAREAGAVAALWDASASMPEGNAGIALIRVNDTLEALQKLSASYLDKLSAKIVAVTGSNGKTTTKDLITSVLATHYRVHKTEGNYNNHIGLPLTILRADPQTQMLVLEMGMSGEGEIAFLSTLARPDIAVVTNVGESHLLQLGSRRNIARAKLEITDGLKPGGKLVYFGDEPLLTEELAAKGVAPSMQIIKFGENSDNDWIARYIRMTAEGTQFNVSGVDDNAYELPIPGRHNAINALAAIAVGRLLGLTNEEIDHGLKTVKLTGMRIERSLAKNGALILNDAYNASPTSVKAAINLIAELSGYKTKWLVLGDMLELGPDEAEFHAEIGRYLTAAKADRVLLYGTLSEHAFAEARTRFTDDNVIYFKEKSALADYLLGKLAPEDLVLVKASRGMKLEVIVAALEKGAVE
jgi:UDP-N-acetylmuramoyl-tripeptide--D-alanyl-D-alanine ligase